MKYLKLIFALAALTFAAMAVTGCSRHPKVDFSVPTEATEPTTETTVPEPTTEAAATETEPGFQTADEAYDAYLAAVEAQDVEAFCALFHAGESENAKSVPSKFLKNNFGIKLEADVQTFQMRTEAENFRKLVAANFNSYQSAMTAFGEAGETWHIEPGNKKTMRDSQVQSFANSLHIEVTRGAIRDMFLFIGDTSGAQVEGESVYLLCIEGRWYPSYTKECVPAPIDISDFYPEGESGESEAS